MWLFAWILTTAAPAQGEPAAVEAGTEVRALRSVIEDQITAFRAEDAQAAWRVVAPGLQEKFGTADRFLQLVRDQYPAVYAPRSYEFGAIEAVPGGLGQWLDVVGPDGRTHRALYLMERQPDGSWKTMGCLMIQPDPAPPRA